MTLGRASCLTHSCRTLISAVLLILAITSCAQQSSTVTVEPSSPTTDDTETGQIPSTPTGPIIWSDKFATTDWKQPWRFRSDGTWGLENTKITKDPSGKFSQVLRVSYPADSASPAVARRNNAPLGGAQFFADLGMTPRDSVRLSYYLRFSDNFDYVKGGKLPGLFGGRGNSGGRIPDGIDGFSTRFMWRRNGDGEVYAYLPTSKKDGTSIGRGNWRFEPGKWYRLEQEVRLNKPGENDGRIRVWVDGREVLDQQGLTFRTVDQLKIEGIFFSTFFGGGNPSWATPKDVYVDFADFSVMSVN